MSWLRLPESALDNRKIQRLPNRLFEAWINLLCVASRYGGALPPLPDIAFALRRSAEETAKALAMLQEARLLDEVDGTVQPHDWNARPYRSDVSTERVECHRERKRQRSGEPAETVSRNAPEQSGVQAPFRAWTCSCGAIPSRCPARQRTGRPGAASLARSSRASMQAIRAALLWKAGDPQGPGVPMRSERFDAWLNYMRRTQGSLEILDDR